MTNWLLAPVVFLLLPILIPFAVLCGWLHRRRLEHAARESGCPECGTILGVDALELAKIAVRERMAERRRQYPNIKFRLARSEDAVCPRCGVTLRYDETTRTFHLLKPSASVDQPNA